MSAHVSGFEWQTGTPGGGGGGWTDDGTVVRLTASTDELAVGIDTMSGAEKARIRGEGTAAKGLRIDEASASSGALLEIVGAASRTGRFIDVQMNAANANADGIYVVNSANDYACSMIWLEATGTNALGPGSAGSMIDLLKQPSGAADGEGLTIQFNSNTTGMGIEMTHQGSGTAQLITKAGNALALSVQKSSGTGTVCQMQKSGGTAGVVLELVQGTAQAGLQVYPTLTGGYCALFQDLVNSNTATKLVHIQSNRQGSTGAALLIDKVPATSATGGQALLINTGANATGNVIDVDHAGSGRLIYCHTGATELFSVMGDGKARWPAAATQTTVGAAGAASALPATPSGYLMFYRDGTEFVVPYFAKA